MRVLLVYPDVRGALRLRRKGYFYAGIASISAVLKRAGHSVKFMHLLRMPSEQDFLREVAPFSPQIVCFSSTTNQFPVVRQCAEWLKRRMPDVLTVCGGVHPTLNPEDAIAAPGIDILCRGEGEDVMIALCRRMEEGRPPDDLRGLWVRRRDGTIVRNPPAEVIADLDSLPYPDREIFPAENLNDPSRLVVMASRGCPYNCAYCCNQALRELYGARKEYMRFRSVDHVLGEIEQALRHYGIITRIAFDDDILPLRKEWFRRFAQEYRRRVGMPFLCNLRANLVDDETVELLREAGCQEVALGVESGSERVLNEVLCRHLSKEQIASAFERLVRCGIRVHSYNMVGIPTETLGECLETVKFNARVKSDWRAAELRVTIFYPYYGTSLYDLCVQKGWITDRQVLNYADDSILAMDSMSRGEIRFFARYFRLLTMLYSRIFSLKRGGRTGERLLDSLVQSWPARKLAYPVLNGLYPVAVWVYRALDLVRRKILRRNA